MSYKEKLNKLFFEAKPKYDKKLVDSVKDIDLTFDYATEKSLKELNDFVLKFMNKYSIGDKISKRFWGIRGYKRIQSSLYDQIKKQMQDRRPVTQIGLFDDLQQDVRVKDKSNYDISRVARTEGKSITVIYQLEKFKQAGLKYVKYQTRGDNKVRPAHAMLNGKLYEIDHLLSAKGEKDRIPLGVNCRCRYVMSMKGI